MGLEELPTDLYGQTIIHTNGRPHCGHPPCDTDGCRSLEVRLEEPGVSSEEPGWIYAPGAESMGVCVQV